MKITLKITAQQLSTLVYFFDSLKTVFSTESREVKVSRFILEKTALKIRKKHLENQTIQNTLFTKKNKKISIGIEYYEAHYLEQFLLVVQKIPLSDYDRNVAIFLSSILNQQLA